MTIPIQIFNISNIFITPIVFCLFNGCVLKCNSTEIKNTNQPSWLKVGNDVVALLIIKVAEPNKRPKEYYGQKNIDLRSIRTFII